MNEWMNEWMSVRSHNEGSNHALFLAERPRREKVSHRSPHRVVDALSKFELHRCLLRCERECKGVGDVGPNFGTHVPDLGAREYFNLLILDRLSRKLDASRSIVKICWSFFRSAEPFSPGARGRLLVLSAHACHGSDPIEIPGAGMNPRARSSRVYVLAQIDETKRNQTGKTFGDKQGKKTEDNGQESSQQRTSSR